MLIPVSHLLFILSAAQQEAGGPEVGDPKLQELSQRKGGDSLAVPGVVMMGDSDVNICFHTCSLIPLTCASVLHETHTDFPTPPPHPFSPNLCK